MKYTQNPNPIDRINWQNGKDYWTSQKSVELEIRIKKLMKGQKYEDVVAKQLATTLRQLGLLLQLYQ